MRKFVGGLVVALAVAVGPAHAADTPLIDAFTVANVSNALTELNATDIKTYDAPGNNQGVSALVGGYQVHISIQHCNPGCVGMLAGVGFSTDGREVSAETLLSFTRRYPPTPAARISDGKGISIMRALISNGGITNENLKANIAMLVLTVPTFVKHVTDANVASAAPGGTTALMKAGAPLRQIPLTPADMQWALPPAK